MTTFDFEATGSAVPFQLVPAETPGGGRIKNKADPPSADLVAVPGYGGVKVPMHRNAARALEAMTAAARGQKIEAPLLLPISGYRTTASQRPIFARAVKRYGSESKARIYVAKPGSSAHHSGRAVDLYLGSAIDSRNVDRIRQTAAWRWLRDNAVRFGFYPYEKEPWHWEYNPPAAASGILEQEDAPVRGTDPLPGMSRILPFKGKGRWPSSIGIYVPTAAVGAEAIDVVVYFHGHIIRDCATDPGRFSKEGMAYYLSTPHFRCLREQLETSGRRAVLVAPTLATLFGTKSSGTEVMGNFQAPGQFDLVVDSALKDLKDSGAIRATTRIRQIVLAGHSAGGRPMLAVLKAKNRLGSLIRTCWGFECLYFGTAGWVSWLNGNRGSRFIHCRRPQKMKLQASALAKLPNFSDWADGRNHCTVVPQYWTAALKTLDDARVGSDPGAEEGEFQDEIFAHSDLDRSGEQEGSTPVPTDTTPAAVPANDPVPFAPVAPVGSYWPIRTKHKFARRVSFLTSGNKIIATAGRRFLANRVSKKNGKVVGRWHVGIDLFAHRNDVVVACEAGRIVDFSYFYTARTGQKTYRLLIEHEGSGIVVNYGEVRQDSLAKNGLKLGARVTPGQPVGFVSDTDMLHVETYVAGTKTTARWLKADRSRPASLLNPTRYLLHLAQKGLDPAQR